MLRTVLLWFAGHLIAKIVLSLGLGLLTFAGYLEVMDYLESQVVSAWGGIPAAALAYLTIAGFTDALGIILAALSIRAAITFAPRLGLIHQVVT